VIALILSAILAHEPGTVWDDEPTKCSECRTDAECEALCAPCTPEDAEDEEGGNWTCDREIETAAICYPPAPVPEVCPDFAPTGEVTA
jgi:hypothetical protein